MGVAGTASAVHVNPAGIGQALIYPYYTVRNAGGAYNTYLSVANTRTSVKAVKVRFLEGKNGKTVLDFNLYLSAFDVWTGAVIPVNASDPSAGARLITADSSCTTPSYAGNESQFFLKNTAYAGVDGEASDLDRANEGYLEIIEMGDVTGTIVTGIKQVNGKPANCGVLTDAAAAAAMVPGTGGLSGTASLINVGSGTDYGYDPVVLDDFNFVSSSWTPVGSTLPGLGNVQPKISRLINDRQGTVVSTWNNSGDNQADPVSAVLMFNSVINEFVLDSATLSATDWVVTFPTKSYYVGADPLVGGARQNSAAIRPFQRNFGAGGACDEVQVAMHDRESAEVTTTVGTPTPIAVERKLCWQANIVTFNNASGIPSNLMGSKNYLAMDYVYQNGFAVLEFPLISAYPNAHRLANASNSINNGPIGSVVYFGLPAVGFMMQDFVNGNVGSPPVLSSYGGNFEHKGSRLIVP